MKLSNISKKKIVSEYSNKLMNNCKCVLFSTNDVSKFPIIFDLFSPFLSNPISYFTRMELQENGIDSTIFYNKNVAHDYLEIGKSIFRVARIVLLFTGRLFGRNFFCVSLFFRVIEDYFIEMAAIVCLFVVTCLSVSNCDSISLPHLKIKILIYNHSLTSITMLISVSSVHIQYPRLVHRHCYL